MHSVGWRVSFLGSWPTLFIHPGAWKTSKHCESPSCYGRCHQCEDGPARRSYKPSSPYGFVMQAGRGWLSFSVAYCGIHCAHQSEMQTGGLRRLERSCHALSGSIPPVMRAQTSKYTLYHGCGKSPRLAVTSNGNVCHFAQARV